MTDHVEAVTAPLPGPLPVLTVPPALLLVQLSAPPPVGPSVEPSAPPSVALS